MIQDRPMCTGCKHFNRDTYTCTAFPKGIPIPILLSQKDHRKPYPGDNGIRFEPVNDAAAEYAEARVSSGEWRQARLVDF